MAPGSGWGLRSDAARVAAAMEVCAMANEIKRRAQQVGELSEDGYRIIERGGRYFVEMYGTEGRVRGRLIDTYGSFDTLRFNDRGWADIRSARRFILDERHAEWEIEMGGICEDCHHSAEMGVQDCDCWCHDPQNIPIEPRR